HRPVEAARLKRPAIRLRLLAPERLARIAVQEPKDARIKPLAPVRPALALLVPFAADRVHRHIAGVLRDESAALGGGEIEGRVEGGELRRRWFGMGGHG